MSDKYIYVKMNPYGGTGYEIVLVTNDKETILENGKLFDSKDWVKKGDPRITEALKPVKEQARQMAVALKCGFQEDQIDLDEVHAAIKQDRVTKYHAMWLVKRLEEEKRSSSYIEDRYDEEMRRNHGPHWNR